MEKKNDVSLLVSQKHSISQSLQYSLRILEMSNLELRDHVRIAINENPFLKDDSDNDSQDFQYSARGYGAEFLENIAPKYTLKDDIFKQMLFLRFNDEQKEIANMLIEHVVENKYLNGEILKNISKEKNISYFHLLQLIKKLQTLSPYGLFAFNLRDKIKSALEASNKYDDDFKTLIQNFDFVMSRGLSALKTRCGFNDDKLSKIISGINEINFNFDSCFSSEDYLYKIPDIVIESKTKNEYEASLNEASVPQLSIDRDLYELSAKKCVSGRDKKYVRNKIVSAELVVKSIYYRNSTLLKIMNEILYRQQEFLAGINSCLNPISVKSIANVLLLHESTVHRAIANKTVLTPRGTFDMKVLTPREIKSSNAHSELASDYSIKEYIKNLIGNEPKDSPYSDDHIVHFLGSKGVNLSRRTISKYRTLLRIPNVSMRIRSYKMLSC